MRNIDPSLNDLGIDIIRYISFFTAPIAFISFWRTLNVDPISVPRLLYFLAISAGSWQFYIVAHTKPLQVRTFFFVGSNLMFVVGMFLYDTSLLIFFAPFIILTNAIVWKHGEFISAAVIGLAAVYLVQYKVYQYPMEFVAAHLSLAVGLSWLISRILSTAIEWYSQTHQHSVKLLNETRDHRAKLTTALKSLEISYMTQQQIKQDLLHARKQAEEAQRLKERFVANISHELRTPLSLILGFSEVMYFSPEVYGDVNWTPLLTRDVNQIYRSSRHLMEMIDDILDLSYFEQASFVIERKPVHFSRFMEETVELVNNLFQKGPLHFSYEIETELPEVEIDSTRIRQVILNLLNNARRFTDSGFVKLEARRREDKIQVKVTDSGSGIPADQLRYIFDDYYQVDYSLSRRHGGAGLGLAISKRFIEAHDGQIWVESQLGVGSSFTFEIPSTTGRTAYVQQVAPLSVKPPIRLLTIGSSHLDRQLIKSTQDMEIYHLGDPAELEQAIQTYHPRAIVEISTGLPSISAHTTKLPTITCKLVQQVNMTSHLHITGHLSKPINFDKLKRAIGNDIPNIQQVMVIDDDPDFGQLMDRMLHTIDPTLKVTRTTDGYDALQKMQSNPPDVALVDLIMPDLNGLEIIALMRDLTVLGSTKIFLLTVTDYAAEAMGESITEFNVRLPDSDFPFEIADCIHATSVALRQRYVT